MRIYTTEEKKFIQDHLQNDPATLMLQAKRYPHLPILELVQQIQARQKANLKLPTWAQHTDTVFPVTLSVEQSSSEVAAAFKASVISGKLLVDLTGGFGVDSFYFAKNFEQVIHIEQNTELQQIAAFNFSLLKADNIQSFNIDAETFLESFSGIADVIYLDPARRGDRKEKLHLLQDCEPDILSLLPLLFSKAKSVLLKTSPMLDIDLAIEQLGYVHKVWVVAIQNEVKEVLYFLQPIPLSTPEITQTAVNLYPEGKLQSISFTKGEEESAISNYADPQTYIYEPNAAILKAGAYCYLGNLFKLNKLHPNSHLYTSETKVHEFPGRSFKCINKARYNKKELLAKLPDKKANITVRNFPESVAEIRKKTGIKEGGEIYLFFTTDMHQKPIILICKKA